MRASYESIWKKYHFSSKGIRKGTFSGQNSLQKGKGWDLGTEPPHIELSPESQDLDNNWPHLSSVKSSKNIRL